MGHRAFKLADIDIKAFFTAKNLMTEFSKGDLFSENQEKEELIQYLKLKNYDFALIQQNDSKYGYVLLEELISNDQNIINNIHQIDKKVSIKPNTPISTIINKFNNFYYLFVFNDENQLKGVITYSDLNKPPIYAFCYLLISKFESLLRNVISIKYENEEWLKHLSEENQKGLRGIFISEKVKGIEISLLKCTTITHLIQIFKKDGLWQIFEYSSKKNFRSKMAKVINYRNATMHNRDIIHSKDGGKDLFEFIKELGDDIEKINDWLKNN